MPITTSSPAFLVPEMFAPRAWRRPLGPTGPAGIPQRNSRRTPVTERSGKTLWVHHRLACPKFVKQTFHEFSDQSIRFSRWARAYYDQQRARGNDHHAALRALAYKWIRILFRCWKERRPYDEDTYIEALRRHGSPLAKNIA